jgi:hypothetical protein
MTDPKTPDLPTHPVAANDPTVQEPPLTLVGFESFGPNGLTALDAFVAERVLGFERRKIGGKWMWRAPRDPAPGAPRAEWEKEPPVLATDDYGPAVIVLRRAGERLKYLWRLGMRGCTDQHGNRVLAFLAELGPHRALAVTPELACVVAIAKTAWKDFEALVGELSTDAPMVQ